MSTVKEILTDDDSQTFILRNENYEISVCLYSNAVEKSSSRAAVWRLKRIKDDMVILDYNEMNQVLQCMRPLIPDMVGASSIQNNTLEAMEGVMVDLCGFEKSAVDSLIGVVVQHSFCSKRKIKVDRYTQR